MKTIDLTDEEIEVLDNYLFRKLGRLEDSNLKDSKCYNVLSGIHFKLKKLKK